MVSWQCFDGVLAVSKNGIYMYFSNLNWFTCQHKFASKKTRNFAIGVVGWVNCFCFSAFPGSLLFCSLLSLLLCFSASLLSLLLCFPCFSAFLLLASAAFYLYYSTFSFLQSYAFCRSTSCSSASLLPVFTVSLFFIFFCFKYSPLFVS